jgi:hypothetical protein
VVLRMPGGEDAYQWCLPVLRVAAGSVDWSGVAGQQASALPQGFTEVGGMTVSTLTAIRGNVGSCREWVDEKNNVCAEPADFVLWGKLIPREGFGPRCHDHAAKHVGHRALSPHSGYALVNLGELADVIESMEGTAVR